MVSLVAVIIWRLPFAVVLFGFLVFGTLDGLYLSSALTKIPDGAWFTLALAVLLSSIFILWRYGKENQWRAESADRIPLRQLLLGREPNIYLRDEHKQPATLRLATNLGGASLSPLRGMGIFFDKTGDSTNTPTVFVHFLQKFQAIPAVAVFFHIRPLSRPTVPTDERYSISRCFGEQPMTAPLHNLFRITIRHGYTDEVITPDLGMVLYEQLRNIIIREASARSYNAFPPSTPLTETPGPSSAVSDADTLRLSVAGMQQRERLESSVRQQLETIKAAFEDQVVYVVGKEQMRIQERHDVKNLARRMVLSAFLWLRSNTGSKVANLNIDPDKLVELGFVKLL